MKKSTSIIIASVISLVTVLGATYAWFVASADTQAIEVSTANLAIETSRLIAADVSNKLPGQSVRLNTVETPIRNTGSRPAIIRLEFNASGYITKELENNGKAIPTQDYAPTVDEEGRREIEPERLSEVVSVDMQTSGSNWIKVGKAYYTRINNLESYNLGATNLNVLGELGGNFKKSDGTKTLNRPYEMEAKFSAGYKITAVQASGDAVSDTFGADVYGSIKNLKPAWFIY